MKHMLSKLKKLNKNTVVVIIAVIAIAVTGILVSNKSLSSNVLSFFKVGESRDAIAKKSIDYLNNSVLQDGQTATLKNVSQESGLVKLEIAIGTNTYTSYATRDGKLLFPEAFNLGADTPSPTATTTPDTTATGSITPANVAKVAKTSLEAYVVSSCPFGLQMQRAMYNAVTAAPALAEYIKVRYIGAVAADGKTITAMHGVEEAQENLRQICIREEQPSKYWKYVGKYMEATAGTAANGMPYGDTKAAQTFAGIDSAKLNACVTDTARGIAYAKADFALAAQYNVSGSPTLILNGKEASETPFGGRAAIGVSKMVCSSSTTPPAFCKDVNFSVDQASTSFSLTYAAPGGTGATANCAPAV